MTLILAQTPLVKQALLLLADEANIGRGFEDCELKRTQLT